jgi:heme exporter protein D
MIDTASYYHAAYAVAGVLYLLYAVSLVLRRRTVLQRLAALERGNARG